MKYPDWGARHPFYVANYRGQQYAALPHSLAARCAALLLLLAAAIIGGLGLRRYQSYPVTS